MKIAISGASGFIGKALSNYLQKFGYDIITISKREIFSLSDKKLQDKITGCYAVINLCGAPIAKRWTSSYKREIYNSRLDSTERLISIINRSTINPNVFISTSAIGIYNRKGCHNESSTDYDNTFLSKLCVKWEKKTNKLNDSVRLVILRLSIVMDNSGGYIKNIEQAPKKGLSVSLGDKNMEICWISLHDLLRVYEFALFNPQIKGIVNACCTKPITQHILTDILHKKYNARFKINIPNCLIKLFAGENAEIFTLNQCATPQKLLKNEFTFEEEDIEKVIIKNR